VQALYQWQLGRQPLSDIELQFLELQDTRRMDTAYFRELLHRVPARAGDLDQKLADVVARPLAQVDPVEHAVLWVGAYELLEHPELPWRVILNEAVELAKVFGATESHRFVNAALDRLAAQVRAVEIEALGGRRGGAGPGEA
jgi:N utilization substance protein B